MIFRDQNNNEALENENISVGNQMSPSTNEVPRLDGSDNLAMGQNKMSVSQLSSPESANAIQANPRNYR